VKKPNAPKPLRLDARTIRPLDATTLSAIAGASVGANIVEPIRPPRFQDHS
jgi:hypothetical protein